MSIPLILASQSRPRRDVLFSAGINPANRLIFQAARALFRAGVTPDAVTIRDKIGPDYSRYMAELVEITPTAANWEAYARYVIGQSDEGKSRKPARATPKKKPRNS